MGTSKGYTAPTTPQWRQVKQEVTRYSATGSVSDSQAEKIMASFVRALGHSGHGSGGGDGTGGGARIGSSTAARQSAQKLARFVSSVASGGLNQALQEVGLGHLVGRSTREILLNLVNEFCGTTNTFEEVDARRAMSDLANDMLESLPEDEDATEVLEQRVARAGLGVMLFNFFGYYLYNQFCRVFYERLVRKHGEAITTNFLKDIRDFVIAALKNRTYGRDLAAVAWAGAEGQRIIDDIMQLTLEVFES